MPFILDRPKASTPTFIFLKVKLFDGVLKYPVKEKCLPANWRNYRTVDKNINLTLNRIETHLAGLIKEARANNTPLTKTAVKAALDAMLHRRTVQAAFFAFVKSEIAARESGKVLTGGGKLFSKYTIRNYNNTLSLLWAFDKKTTFQDVDAAYYDRLIAYSTTKGHSINMIGQTVKNLRVFMRAAARAGLHGNTAFERFKIPDEVTPDVYLTTGEIHMLIDLSLPTERLRRVRDWFVLDCFTGLRISDIKALSLAAIKDGVIRLVNEKTDVTVAVPVHRCVADILARYGGLPRKISDQKMNEYIKEVCRMAGICSPVLHSITKGGRRIDTRLEKWQVISNHTARRSFITNLLKAGITHIEVMKLSGLKKLSTVQRYHKETGEEIAERLKLHEFFK